MFTLRKNQLLDLPQELLAAEILGRLNFRDVLHCSMTCKLLHGLTTATSALQLKIELGADGIIDTMAPVDRPTSSAERLQTHLDRRRRWSSMSSSNIERITMPRPCEVYAHSNGVFAQTENHERGDTGTTYSSLTVFYLPSPTRSAREIVFEDIGILVAEMTFDPAQDVLALIERRGTSGHDTLVASSSRELLVHLRTLTTNRSHPFASKPILRCLRPDTMSITEECIRKFEIFDDTLALLVETQNMYIRLWNWKSGEVIFKHDSNLQLASARTLSDDFCFLSPGIIATFVPGEKGDGRLEIHSTADGIRSITGNPPSREPCCGKLVHISSLLLPPLRDANYYSESQLRTSSFSPQCPPSLLLLKMAYETDTTLRDYHMVLCCSNLLHHALKQVKDDVIRPVPWLEWGPDSSRIFLQDPASPLPDPSLVGYISGKRIVSDFFLTAPEATAQERCAVVEFGYHLLREEDFPRSLEASYNRKGDRPPVLIKAKSEPDIFHIGNDNPFSIAFEARLPYRSILLLETPFDFDSPEYKISEDQLLVLELGSSVKLSLEMVVFSF